ncbi:hypothetical protein BD311DRAFT_779195 [Dichomitus squalens]|uniref:Uncharacterized protein n=1 Tax=Dichomitus squalens TaxID=114155 RepID=A0A4V2K010_9APHY|nr:hypothetical protein BD311DRAFT_779195 [Dichomitus squalens]
MAASAKAHWIIGRKLRITFTGNKPLTDLMHDFRMLIWQRTVAHPYEQEPQYLTHAAVLELLDKALARSNEWPDAKSEGSKPFVRPPTVSVHLDQPKRHAEQDAGDSESTAKRSRRQSKKENGTATGDPFESTSNPQLTTVKGSSRGSRGRAGGGSKTRGSEKQQS